MAKKCECCKLHEKVIGKLVRWVDKATHKLIELNGRVEKLEPSADEAVHAKEALELFDELYKHIQKQWDALR